MAKPEWGTKRICLNCGARFYDLGREPIVCPNCGTPHDPVTHVRPRRARAAPKLAAVAPEEPEEVARTETEDEEEVTVEPEEDEAAAKADDGDDEEEDEEEDTDSAIEDVSELSDDDVTDVIDTDVDDDESER